MAATGCVEGGGFCVRLFNELQNVCAIGFDIAIPSFRVFRDDAKGDDAKEGAASRRTSLLIAGAAGSGYIAFDVFPVFFAAAAQPSFTCV